MSAKRDTADSSFARSIVGAIVFGFLALIVLALVSAWSIREADIRGERVSRTYEVETTLREFVIMVERSASARRGFLLTADPRFADRMEETASEAQALFAGLLAQTSDNPDQQARLQAISETWAQYRQSTLPSIEALRADPTLDGRTLFTGEGSVVLIEDIRNLARETIAAERQLLDQRMQAQQRTQLFANVILAVSFVLLLLVATVTIWSARRTFRELKRSRRVLEGMNELLEGAVAVRTADLQRANAEIQRFAYIVSHDLRSPLVNVMGFTAELDAATSHLRALVEKAEAEAPQIVDEEARLAVREDLPEAIGFIRSSTQKMDRLINAILRLSREGRRVITPEPLDMGGLVRTIVDTLQHRLGETDSTVEIEGDLPSITSDRVAIEQIFSNLIENAVKYRKPDQPVHVRVRGRKAGPRIVYEVEDDGRGIDPKDHERVFDLFRRSGQQDRPGEGIGLAHVRAMAYRLGATVSCESALDKGATFRLSIPETFDGNKDG